ncbi:DUF3563 family protein [Microvirga sp. 0TCS3.31]
MVLFSLCKLASFDLPPLTMKLGRHLGRIRHKFLPSDEERDMEHLASASDLHELEARIRELDRSKR